MLLNK